MPPHGVHPQAAKSAMHNYLVGEAQKQGHLPTNPLKNVAPTRGPMPTGQQAIPRSHARLASGIGHAFAHAAKQTYEISPFSKDSYLQARGNKAAMARESKATAGVSEALTGYKEIKSIRQHPLAGSIALAGILPFGRFGKVLEEGSLAADAARGAKAAKAEGKVTSFLAERKALKIARRGPSRTSEEASTHVLETAKKARQQGFGRLIPKLPTVAPGEVSAETGGQAGKVIRQGLNPDFKAMGKYEKVGAKLDNPGLAALRNKQEELRAVERSKRAGAIERASEGKTGLARHVAAKAQLEGKLPAGIFKGFSELTPELRDQAINHIYDHPHFQPFEKVNAADALDQAIAGKVPTKGEQKLLERAFGREQAQGLIASVKQRGIGQTLANILGVPRSIMASGDLSAPFRQGLAAMASHPKIFFQGFPDMFKAAGSEDRFQTAMRSIHEMPEFPLMEKGKLALTDIGETAKSGAADLNKREEQMISNLAEQIPGIGRVIRGSDRAYVGFLNMTRARLFATFVHQAAENGWHLNDQLIQDIGKVVNTLTGRGDLKALENHTATMNALFFSPRLLYSRLNLLGLGGSKLGFIPGSYYATLHPFARAEAAKAATRLFGTLSAALFFARMAGAKVNTDPRNADFGKIRIGNTRLDIAGGFTQPIRLADQLATGQIVSSTSGKVENLGGGFAQRSRLSVAGQFVKGKLAPVPSIGVDLLSGSQFGGQPITPQSEIQQHLEPLVAQDIQNIHQGVHSIGATAAYGVPDIFGVGVNNYAAQPANSPAKVKAATDKAMTKLQHEENVLNVPSQWRKVYARGVSVETKRSLAKDAARKASKSGKITQAQSYKITMKVLRDAGMMNATEYRQAVAAIPKMNDRELKHWEYEAWAHLGPGLLLEKLHHYYNVKTGQ